MFAYSNMNWISIGLNSAGSVSVVGTCSMCSPAVNSGVVVLLAGGGHIFLPQGVFVFDCSQCWSQGLVTIGVNTFEGSVSRK